VEPKLTPFRGRPPIRLRNVPPPKISVEGSEIVATLPEGQTARMPLEAFIEKLIPTRMESGTTILPDGVKAVMSKDSVTVWVYESPPQVHRLRWIANDSPVPCGHGTTYREVRIALPYLIVLAVFVGADRGRPQLSGYNECFFRNEPLKGFHDPLCYPALLNCSRFLRGQGKPLSWICTARLQRTPKMNSPVPDERMQASFAALRHCLLETAFNRSSERHEGSSWFDASRSIDPRIQTIEAWEEASAQDPLFVLDVPWINTGHTLQQVVDRIYQYNRVPKFRTDSLSAFARIIFNYQSTSAQPQNLPSWNPI